MRVMSHVTERVFTTNSCTDALPFQFTLNLRRRNTTTISTRSRIPVDRLKVFYLYLKCRKILSISITELSHNYASSDIFPFLTFANWNQSARSSFYTSTRGKLRMRNCREKKSDSDWSVTKEKFDAQVGYQE